MLDLPCKLQPIIRDDLRERHLCDCREHSLSKIISVSEGYLLKYVAMRRSRTIVLNHLLY